MAVSKEEGDTLIIQGVLWALEAASNLQRAGGHPGFIKEIPQGIITSMVRNNLNITYWKDYH